MFAETVSAEKKELLYFKPLTISIDFWNVHFKDRNIYYTIRMGSKEPLFACHNVC